MPKITVLMPSLNVKKFIIPCIESVLQQTLQEIEVLAIDAGSTDGTLEILEEYAARDSRLRVIKADKKSYGYQMNIGLEQATGEYIGIVETDDYISSDMYDALYQMAVANDLDYIKGGFSLFVELENGVQWHQNVGAGALNVELVGRLIEPRCMPELFRQDFYLWAGIYRRELLEEIRLNETPGAAFQDIGFLFQVLKTAKRALYLDKPMYSYRQTKGNSSQSQKGFQYLIQEYDYLKRKYPSMEKEWIQAYYEKMFRQILGRFQRMAATGSYWQETSADVDVLRQRLHHAIENGQFTLASFGDEDRLLYSMLQRDDKELFTYYFDALQMKWNSCKGLFRAIANHSVVIFGCGKYGEFTYALLECYRQGQVKAFCDNNAERWNAKVQNSVVLSPMDAVERYPHAKYVVANLKNTEVICEQLQGMGITEEQIYVYQPKRDWQLFMMEE